MMAEVIVLGAREQVPPIWRHLRVRAVAWGCGHSRRRGHGPGPAQPGRLAGERGLPGRGARSVLLGPAGEVPAVRWTRLARPAGEGFRGCRGRAGLAGRPGGLHGQDRGHRLLHRRRVRAAARPGPRVLSFQRELRGGRAEGRVCGESWRARVPSSAATALGTGPIEGPRRGWTGPWRLSAWTMTSRSTRTPGTPSSTTSRCRTR